MVPKKKKTSVKTATKKKVVKMPNKWSFSRWSTYNKCPLQAKLGYIDGWRGEGGDASARGTEIHALAEKWLKAKKKKKLPPIFAAFKKGFDKLYELRATSEIPLGITRDWKPCEFADADYWWHGEIDAVAIVDETRAIVVDFKTGRVYPEHKLQLEIYAIAMFLHVEELTEVQCDDWYVDLGKVVSHVFKRSSLKAMITAWENRLAPMFRDREFCPKPSPLCPWCIASKENGLCRFALSEEAKEEKFAASRARKEAEANRRLRKGA